MQVGTRPHFTSPNPISINYSKNGIGAPRAISDTPHLTCNKENKNWEKPLASNFA